MSEPIGAGLLAIESVAKLYRLAEDERLAKRIVNFFRHKDTILVLGSTGSGKTNLLNSLEVAAALVKPIPATTRTQTPQKKTVIVNERPFVVIDTPGQAGHAPERQELYRESMAKPPVRVINVVSYGYHEYASGSEEALDENGVPRPEWLEQHRESELAAMREWLPLLGHRDTTLWVLTAVTKADLWWDHHDSVMDHYQSGVYAKELKSEDGNLKHSVLKYSSVFHRFYGESALAGTFDDQDRLETTRHFLEELAALG